MGSLYVTVVAMLAKSDSVDNCHQAIEQAALEHMHVFREKEQNTI